MSFADRVPGYVERVERALEARLPLADARPASLHTATAKSPRSASLYRR